MATQKVSFQVEIDDDGVAKAVDDIGSKLDRAGTKGTKAFTSISEQQKKAREASLLLSEALGVQIPSSLDKVLAKSKTVGPALAEAFETGLWVAAAAAAIKAIGDIYNMWITRNDEVDRILRAAELKRAEDMQATSDAALSRNNALRIQAATALTGPLATIDKQLNEELFQNSLEMVHARTTNDLNSQILLSNQVIYLEKIAAAERIKIRRQFADQAADAEMAAARIGLQGAAAVLAQMSDTIAKINRDAQRGQYAGTNTADQLSAAARLSAQKQILEMVKSANLQERQLYMQTQEMEVGGETAIEVATRNRINEQMRLFQVSFGALSEDNQSRILAEKTLQNTISDLTRQGEIQRQNLRQQYATETAKTESDAAILMLPPWQRANAQIVADYNAQLQEIERERELDLNHHELYDQRIVALEELKNAKIIDQNRQTVEQMGSDIEGAWDDITSGNIGKRILDNAKKFFGQIAAAGLLGMKGGGSNAMTGLLGTLLFPQGSTTQGALTGGGAGASIGGMLQGVQGGSVMSTPPYFGGGATIGGALGLGGGAGASGNAVTGGGVGGVYGASGGYGPAGSSSAGPQASGLSLPSVAGLGFGGGGVAALGALAPFAGLGLGQKFGGTAGMIGGALAGLAGAVALGNPIAIQLATKLGLIGPLQAFLGPAAGGLVGFGVGMQHGGVAGSLSGAGTGALVGFLAGGPVGALIGGLVGLLGGIFGGLFGGSKRRKQANDFVDQTVVPDVAKILAEYKGFQLDYASAITGLTQLQTDAGTQLATLKGEGNDVFNSRVIPAISSARQTIEGTENERQRRAGLQFAPPAFAQGGFVSPLLGGMRTGDGGIVSIIHPGEFVSTAKATSKNRSVLEAMNAGQSVQGAGGDTHVHLYPQKIDADWLRNGGAVEISRALKVARMEGKA